MIPKGILRKQGIAYKTKSLQFKENVIEDEPSVLSTPAFLTEKFASELEQTDFRQVWREVSSKKLEHAARKLQKFARKFMLCWILTNDRRSELYEELESIHDRLQGDLERLEWEKEDMQQEAELQVQAERENAPPGEYNQVREDLITIKALQTEIRSLKQENQQIRLDSKNLKKKNKQLGYDLKEKAPAVEMSRHKVTYLEKNHLKIAKNHAQYLPSIRKWQDTVDHMTAQVEECRRQGHAYRDACLKIFHEVQLRYNRRKVVDKLLHILNQDFAQHHPVPLGIPESPEESLSKSEHGKHRRGRKSIRRSRTGGDVDAIIKPKETVRKTKTDSEVDVVNRPNETSLSLLHHVVDDALETNQETGMETVEPV